MTAGEKLQEIVYSIPGVFGENSSCTMSRSRKKCFGW